MATAEEMQRLHAVVPAAQAALRKYGIPASVTLAQWIFESSDPKKGWGQSQLSLEANNYFGVKASHLNAPETYEAFPTEEYIHGKKTLVKALFEKYFDAADSFEDHARLLATAARYRAAMACRKDPDKFAWFLQRGGYSTAPDYAQMLIRAMHDYDLYQYDTLPPAALQEAA